MSDLGICVIFEVHKEENEDASILHGTGSAVTVCPSEFQAYIATRDDVTASRCEAAARTAVTFGGPSEILAEVSASSSESRM